jgi:hypothetical protein
MLVLLKREAEKSLSSDFSAYQIYSLPPMATQLIDIYTYKNWGEMYNSLSNLLIGFLF